MAYTIANLAVAGGVSPSTTSHTVSHPGTGGDGKVQNATLRVRNLDPEYALRVSRSATNSDGGLLVRPGEVLEVHVKPETVSTSTQFYFFTDKPTGTVAFEVSS